MIGEAVREASRRILDYRRRARASRALLEGLLVQRQAKGELELALGVKRDPVFGPVVMVAAGGVLVETLRDFRLLVPPIDMEAAEEALRALRIAALWDGVRGRPPLDLAAAAELLVRLGEAARARRGGRDGDGSQSGVRRRARRGAHGPRRAAARGSRRAALTQLLSDPLDMVAEGAPTAHHGHATGLPVASPALVLIPLARRVPEPTAPSTAQGRPRH